MLTHAVPSGTRTIVRIQPATSAVVSWNTRAVNGHIDLAVYRADGALSTWLPYVQFGRSGRRSLGGGDGVAKIATDIVQAASPIVAITPPANRS